MNAAHFHILSNHIPVVGLVFCTLFYLVAILRKDAAWTKIALIFVFVCGLLVLPAYLSGEGAEEIVKKYPGVSKDLIHEHEEKAELSFIMMLVLSGVCVLAFAAYEKLAPMWSRARFLILFFMVANMVLIMKAAQLGGHIRHPEIHYQGEIGSDDHEHESDAPESESHGSEH